MAITPGSSQENAYAAPTSPITVSVNVGTLTNGLLVVEVCGLSSNAVSALSATYAAASMNALTLVEYIFSAPNRMVANKFYLAPPTGGANDLVITYTVDFGGSFSSLYLVSSWWEGAFQGTALDQQQGYSGTTDPSGAITPTQDNELVLGMYHSRANNVLTVGSGETGLQNHDFGGDVAGNSYVIQTTAAEQTVDFTGVDDTWVMKLASFKQASAAATPSLAMPRRNRSMGALLVR